MKGSILFLIPFFLFSCTQHNKKKIEDYSSIEKTLQALLQNGEYFKLKTELQENQARLPVDKLQFYQAFVEECL